jgi:2-oxoisovalerate dehydrogenase E1 component
MASVKDRPSKEWIDIYRKMRLIREFEETMLALFKAGELPGFLHSSAGQEAIAVGMTHDLRKDDFIASTHRGHGHVIGKGARVDRMFAELYGKESGYCRGRGGSMHIMDKDGGILGANGIVGACIPIATGAGLTIQIDGRDNVVVCFFGDGAVNTGAFHEAMNLGGIWRLPVIYVCENNPYALSTSWSKTLPIDDLTARGASYGIPTSVIDGNDVMGCLEVTAEAINRARSGNGPTLIQANTYRWSGHHVGDTAPYRTDEEVESWKLRDPIILLEKELIKAKMLTEANAEAITTEVSEEIEAAVEYGRRAEDPVPDQVLRDVFAPEKPKPEPIPGNEGVQRGTVRDALHLAARHAMDLDPEVIVLGEDVADPFGGPYRITLGLSEQFGENRVMSTPISESAIVGAAVGAAMTGKRPIAEIMYIDFLTVAIDQIVNQASFIRYMSGGQVTLPLVIRTMGGAWRGSAAQHSKTLEAWFVHVPGLKVYVPSTPTDAYWLLRKAIEDDNPVLFWEPNLLYTLEGEIDLNGPPDNLDRPAIRRVGSDVTLVTWGYTTRMVLEAADELASQGISPEVIDMRYLAPLPTEEVVRSVAKTGLCCIVHEAWEIGGLGAEIAARLANEAFFYLDGPIKRIGAQHCPHPFSPVLEWEMLPSKERIITTVKDWFNKTS